ncbi:hypothetical protein RB628_02155 [Streptomyces sp. ADMS]|nr:hypothetical protein [Streptomyces sp. ADMS]MDW4904167.1 hypothetical protein [Streptomyces sp. ADMS]
MTPRSSSTGQADGKCALIKAMHSNGTGPVPERALMLTSWQDGGVC